MSRRRRSRRRSLPRVERGEGLADRLERSDGERSRNAILREAAQLATTIETASALFNEIVIEPALTAPTGIERLRQLAENFLRHVEENVYPGGCFFASVAAEMDTRPGRVRDHACS